MTADKDDAFELLRESTQADRLEEWDRIKDTVPGKDGKPQSAYKARHEKGSFLLMLTAARLTLSLKYRRWHPYLPD